MRRPAAKVAFALFFTALVAGLFELATAQLTKRGLLHIHPPTAYTAEADFYDIHPIFGVWHIPNAKIDHPSDCFLARYESNSVGARDRERKRRARAARVIFLGDSFVEGWGLDAEQRMSNRLEKVTGVEHLNFGMAFFSPYQSLLVYQHLAKRYRHRAVILGVLPENDFIDLDLELALSMEDYVYRYRPYLQKTPEGYERLDYVENPLRRLLRRNSYAFVASTTAAASARSWLSGKRAAGPTPSKFYDLRDEQFERLEYIIERLVDEAVGKKVIIVLMPTRRDMIAYRAGNPTPLAQRFEALGAQEAVWIVDLLPLMAEATREWDRYFFPCDYHWNAFANSIAAGFIYVELRGVLY